MEQLTTRVSLVVGLGIDDRLGHSTFQNAMAAGSRCRRSFSRRSGARTVAPCCRTTLHVDGTLIQAWASIKSFVPKERGGGLGRTGDAPPSPPSGAPPGPPAPSTETARSTPRATPMTTTETTPPEPAATSRYDQEAEASAERQGRSEASTSTTRSAETRRTSPRRTAKRGSTEGQRRRRQACLHRPRAGREPARPDRRDGDDAGNGTAECEAAKTLVDAHAPGSERQLTLGADKAYDTAALVTSLREKCVTPHVAQNNKGRRSAMDGRTTRHPGYAQSQKKRKLIEEAFG